MADWGVGQKPLAIGGDGGGLWSALGRDGGYRRFADPYNPKAKPCAWTATADSSLEKISRVCH